MVFDYICFSCYYYTPNKANKKKIKELFEAIPFFLPHDKQDQMFHIIHSYPITSFYDKKETMREYGYIIYRDWHIQEKKRCLEFQEYNDRFLTLLHKDHYIQKKWVKHVIFISAVIIIIYFLYKNK